MESVNKSHNPSSGPDVVLVSAYGRGHWLASELVRRKWKVHLVDVTKSMGLWEPEDWEGPWGFFDTAELLPSQRARLLEREEAFPVASGFTAWLPRGPLELGGPLASFQLHSFGVPESVRKYIEPVTPPQKTRAVAVEAPLADSAEAPSPSPFGAGQAWLAALSRGLRKPDPLKGLERYHRQAAGLPFEESWLAHLAHAAASNVFMENAEAIHAGGPLPLAAPYGIRHCTRESYEESLKELELSGVEVTRNASVLDVRLNGRVLDAIEISAERRGVESGRAFVWMLSSLETKRFPASVLAALFPGGACAAQWAWTRFRFRFHDNSGTRALPLSFAMIENLYLPWTHANFALVKRLRDRAKESEASVRVDAWIRVPARSLGDTAYFERLREELTGLFAKRLPLSQPVCEHIPLESDPAKFASSALRFPLHDKRELDRLETRSGKNFFYDGPEQWSGLDWLSQMRHQKAVLEALDRLKAQWEAAERRGEVQT